LVGRTFVDDETRAGSTARGAVLSSELWQRRFGSDPGLIGRTINLDDTPYQLVGVMPKKLPVQRPGGRLASARTVAHLGAG
jgi:hypothetical protein